MIQKGADVVSSHPEVYLPQPHPAYAAREMDFGAAAADERSSGDKRTDGCAPMDTNGSDVDVDVTLSALGRSAERQAASFVDADGSNTGAGSVSGSSDSGGDVSMADA